MNNSLIIKPFNLKASSKIHLWSPVYSFLCMFNSQRSIWQDLINQAKGSPLCSIIIFLNIINNTIIECLLSSKLPGRENKLLSLWRAYKPTKSLCSPCAWNQTPIRFRKTNKWIFSSNSNISIKRKFQSTSKCRPINKWYNRTMYIPYLVENSSQITNYQFNVLGRFIKTLF